MAANEVHHTAQKNICAIQSTRKGEQIPHTLLFWMLSSTNFWAVLACGSIAKQKISPRSVSSHKMLRFGDIAQDCKLAQVGVGVCLSSCGVHAPHGDLPLRGPAAAACHLQARYQQLRDVRT